MVQLDYSFFLYGFSFLLLAAMGFLLQRRERRPFSAGTSRPAPFRRVLALIGVLIMSWFTTELCGRTVIAETRELLPDETTEIARSINPEEVKVLPFTVATKGALIRATNQDQGTAADRNQIVRVGVLANRGKEICLTEWTPTAEYLSAQLSPRRFEIVPLDFGEVQNVAEQRTVEFLLVNSSMYVTLEYRGLVYRIATFQQPSIKEGGPLPVFGGVIFCRADRNDIRKLRDLIGKRFAAVEPSSFGGWQAAWREFEDLSIHPQEDFAHLLFTGTHDAVVEAVRSGQADAGTVRSTQLERMAMEGAIDLSEFRVLNGPSDPALDYPFLLSTRLYPEWPFATVKETDLELGKSVASALLRMRSDDPAAKASRGAGWGIPQDYTSLHECLRELRLNPYENYGKVTIRQAIVQYWVYILAILAITVAVLVLGFSAFRTSARLKDSFVALRESELKYRSVVENIQDVFYRVDAEGLLALVSPSAARQLGYDSVDDLIGQGAEVFWADPSRRRAMLDELAQSGQVRDWEFEAKRRDGSTLTATSTVQAIRDDHGNPLGYEGIWRDITGRKRAEEEAERLNRQVKLILESAGEGIFGLNSKSDHTFVNPAAARMLGYKADELIGLDSHTTWHYARIDGTFYPKEECPIYTTLRDGIIHQDEEHFLRKDGTGLTVEYSSTPIRESGKIIGAVVTFRDITERKRAEEERLELERQVQQAQKRASLATMAGAIAHHFNNLLFAVLGNLELARHKLPPDPSTAMHLLEAEKAAKRAAELSGLMLTYVGQGVRHKEPLDLAVVIQGLLPMVHSALPGNVRLEFDLPAGGPSVMMDPADAQQVVMNLVTNAWEAIGREDGIVRIAVHPGEGDQLFTGFNPVGASPGAGPWMCLEVADAGVGMDSETQGRIFDPFFSTKFTGRGLGLAVTLGIVRACDGAIFVESEPHRGTTVRVLLPAGEAVGGGTRDEEMRVWGGVGGCGSRAAERGRRGETVTGGTAGGEKETGKRRERETVLLVDDQDMVLDLGQAMLERLGFDVLTARSGREAVEVFRAQGGALCCVILDLTMPGMDGWLTLKALRELRPDVRTVLATGYDVDQLQRQSGTLQPDRWLQKPYEYTELKTVLQQLQPGLSDKECR